MTYKKALIEKFKDRSAKVAVVGLGYVGLPLILRLAPERFGVIGLDIDVEKVNKLLEGKSYIEHISNASIAHARSLGFAPTTDFSKIKEADAIVICVPTPLNKYREPDLGYVLGTVEAMLPHLRAGQLISLESTTYPGTCEEELKPRIEKRGFKIGEDFFLAFSPEREDPGRGDYTTQTIPKVCGGTTPACLQVAVTLYEQIINKVVPVSSTQVAEMTKLLENIHRAVNIGLVNEMKIVADRMGIDIHEVIAAAATKPFGFVAYSPGPGLGGHCIPIDPFYLTWKAREFGVHTRFIELAGEINNSMPDYVVSKVADGLNKRERSIKGSRILVLGIAYKKNVDDVRESPSVQIMEKLRHQGAMISYSDPHVPVFPKMREHKFDLKSVSLTKESIPGYDCVVLATDHNDFDYELLLTHSKLIVDCRGIYRERSEKIIKA